MNISNSLRKLRHWMPGGRVVRLVAHTPNLDPATDTQPTEIPLVHKAIRRADATRLGRSARMIDKEL